MQFELISLLNYRINLDISFRGRNVTNDHPSLQRSPGKSHLTYLTHPRGILNLEIAVLGLS